MNEDQLDALVTAILIATSPEIHTLVTQLGVTDAHWPLVYEWLYTRLTPAIRLAITPVLTAPTVTVTDDRPESKD